MARQVKADSRADQAGNGILIREDADDVGAALDLAIEAFQWICTVNLEASRRNQTIETRKAILPMIVI